jgi:hypothetical protein
LLNALKGVNSGVQDQTIILQPVLKAQTLDNNATPSDLAQVLFLFNFEPQVSMTNHGMLFKKHS